MVQHLGQLGYDVHLLVYGLGEAATIPGVTIHRAPSVLGISTAPIGPSFKKIPLDLSLAVAALAIRLRRSFDLYHGVEEGAFIAGTLALLSRKPFIYDLDSCMATQTAQSSVGTLPGIVSLLQALERAFLRRAKVAIAVCNSLAEKVRNIAPNVKIFQIEDFPFDGATAVDSVLLSELRQKYKTDENKLMVYTGNLEPYQGIDLLLEAMSRISSEKRATIRLLLLGGDEAQINHYRTKAQQQGVVDTTIFVGSRPSTEMGAYMEVADVLVSPRLLGENVPLKIYTYMATGKPIVATNILSHTQVLDCESAFLADPSAKSLAEIIELSLDPSPLGAERRRKVGENGKRLADTRYSKKEFNRKLAEAYDAALEISPASDIRHSAPIRHIG